MKVMNADWRCGQWAEQCVFGNQQTSVICQMQWSGRRQSGKWVDGNWVGEAGAVREY